MNIDGLPPPPNSRDGGNGTGSESEQRFLKLMMAQLANQDPLNPLDNAQLTSQLAQMATVSGIEQLNGAVDALLGQGGFNQALQSAALIGKTVLVPGSDIKHEKKEPEEGEEPEKSEIKFAIDLQKPADSVVVKITDDKGNVIRTIDRGGLTEGVENIVWDGLDDKGNPVYGDFKVSVEATNGGTKVTAEVMTYAKVASVTWGSDGVWLDLAEAGKAKLADIRWIV